MTGIEYLCYAVGKFQEWRQTSMAVKTRIPMEKIMAVKKKLQKLPTKETGKTREEALEILEGDFQEALKKGYSVKEIREILGEEGVTLALSKVAK